jgi:hypothetical protein
MGVGTSSPATRLDVFSTSNVNGAIGQFGSNGVNDSTSVKIYNGSGISETFQSGCIGCFVPGTQVGDAGLRASPGKNIAFGDSGAARLMLDSAGNALQSTRSGGGMVKATAFVSWNGIGICFNSTLSGSAATTPPCGFSFHSFGIGDYEVDFGFQVSDRFFSANGSYQLGLPVNVCVQSVGSCNNVSSLTPNQLELVTYYDGNQTYYDNQIYVIVY